MADKPHPWNIFAISFSAVMALVTLGLQRCDVAKQKAEIAKQSDQQKMRFAEEQRKHSAEVADEKEQNRQVRDIAARSAAAAEASAIATRRSIGLAKNSIAVSQNAIELDQRPWIYAAGAEHKSQDLHLKDHPEVRFDQIEFTFRNYGKTPAFNLSMKAYVVSDDQSYLQLPPWNPLPSANDGLPNVVLPQGEFRITVDPDLRVDHKYSSVRIGYEVEIEYMDIFQHQRRSVSCTGYDGIDRVTFPCRVHRAELDELR